MEISRRSGRAAVSLQAKRAAAGLAMLGLASSFALYGLIHKVRPQPPLGGLAREMLVLTPLSLLAVLALTGKDHSPLLAASAGD